MPLDDDSILCMGDGDYDDPDTESPGDEEPDCVEDNYGPESSP